MKPTTISLIGLICYSLLGGASLTCPGGPQAAITFYQIAVNAKTLVRLLNYAKTASQDATQTVNTSYYKLSRNLSEKQLNGKSIGEMEAALGLMRMKADSLRNTLNQTQYSANALFDMLSSRAEQNKTKELKKSMLADIESKKELFDSKMNTAKDVLKQIDESIQKYDDILGFIQVSSTLNDIDQFINQVNSVISQGSNLNSNIQSAIDEGLAIVSAIEKQAEENSKSERTGK